MASACHARRPNRVTQSRSFFQTLSIAWTCMDQLLLPFTLPFSKKTTCINLACLFHKMHRMIMLKQLSLIRCFNVMSACASPSPSWMSLSFPAPGTKKPSMSWVGHWIHEERACQHGPAPRHPSCSHLSHSGFCFSRRLPQGVHVRHKRELDPKDHHEKVSHPWSNLRQRDFSWLITWQVDSSGLVMLHPFPTPAWFIHFIPAAQLEGVKGVAIIPWSC